MGGMKCLRGCKRPELRLRVGERPAAGAEAGVVVGLTNVSSRGVETEVVLRRVFGEGFVVVRLKE